MAIVKREQIKLDEIDKISKAFCASGFFKDGSVIVSQAQAMVKVMAGHEMGLPPFASMSGIHIVQGKPVLGANLIATLIESSSIYSYKIKISNDEICQIEFYKKGELSGECEFSVKEAARAGLSTKDIWKKYPSDLCFARAISRGARRFCPGIFGGTPVYTPDELDVEMDEEGYIKPEPKVINPSPKKAETSFEDLVTEVEDLCRKAKEAGIIDDERIISWFKAANVEQWAEMPEARLWSYKRTLEVKLNDHKLNVKIDSKPELKEGVDALKAELGGKVIEVMEENQNDEV